MTWFGTLMFNGLRSSLIWSKMDVLAFMVAATVFGPLIWWVADRTPPIDLETWQAFPSEVKPGDTVYRVIRVNRKRICETDPDTLIIDGAKVRWHFEEPRIAAPGRLGIDEYRRPVIIPLQANPGPAEMRVSSTFVCNPIHRIWPIKMVHEPLKFTIVPP
jgi:hypothetical protein